MLNSKAILLTEGLINEYGWGFFTFAASSIWYGCENPIQSWEQVLIIQLGYCNHGGMIETYRLL